MIENKLEKVLNFEGQEVKVITNKGQVLYNLSNSAKVLNLMKDKNRIAWKGNRSVFDKLSKLKKDLGANAPQYIDEINYILDEIDNCDNRNEIYMSRWLTSRLAMECNNDKANKYKNWLATLDESYSKGELTITNQELTNMVSATINSILPTMISSIAEQFTPIINDTRKIVEDNNKRNKQHEENLERLIGIRSKNTQVIGKKLTARESEFYGRRIYCTHIEHKLNRNKLLDILNVKALEDIPAREFENALQVVNTMDLVPVEEINRYKLSGRNKNSYKYELKIVK